MVSILRLVLAIALFSLPSSFLAAQERNIPEELRALAALCSTSASVEFQGEIEGGINRFIGRIIAGEGNLAIGRDASEYLLSFEDENLRLEAGRIYNECVAVNLPLIYGLIERSEDPAAPPPRVSVPDALQVIESGQTFALQVGESVSLDRGGTFAIERARYDGYTPVARMSNGSTGTRQFDTGESYAVPNNRSCRVTFYSRRLIVDEQYVYSFQYNCS